MLESIKSIFNIIDSQTMMFIYIVVAIMVISSLGIALRLLLDGEIVMAIKAILIIVLTLVLYFGGALLVYGITYSLFGGPGNEKICLLITFIIMSIIYTIIKRLF